MPTTPVESDSSNTTFNPYTGKSISKTLLTPCRQIGLSRKRKNSNITLVTSKSLSNDISIQTTELNSEATDIKGNLCISKSISKTLLTPCRQVGLSRKRKSSNDFCKSISTELTYLNTTSESLSNDISVQNTQLNVKADCLITESSNINVLKTSNIIETVDSDDSFVQNVELKLKRSKPEKVKPKKKSVNKALIPDDSDSDDMTLSLLKTAQLSEPPENNVADKLPIHGTKLKLAESVEDVKETKKKIKKCSVDLGKESINVDSLKIPTEPIQKSGTEKQCLDHGYIDKKSPVKIKEREKKCENTSKDNTKETLILSKKYNEETSLAVNSPKNTSNDNFTVKLKENVPVKTYSNESSKRSDRKKLRRSLSLKKSSETYNENVKQKIDLQDSITKHCLVRLSPLDVNHLEKEEFMVEVDDMSKLEQKIKEKREILDALKQAEIYKKLHDVNKLEELTATWKNGCVSALNDLLGHLQGHADIDMAKLLNNLGVSKELITLSEDGNLI